MQRNFRIALANNYYSEPVHLSQYDTNYNIVFEVMEKTSKAPINGMTAYFEGTRCDGLSFRYSGTASDNYVAFSIDTALTAVAGRHTGEIVLYDGSGLWFGSANVQILVEKAARPNNAVDADVESQQTLLEQITSLAEQTEESADGIINMTVSAQTLAQGAEATVTKTEVGGVVNLHFGLPLAGGGTGGGYSPWSGKKVCVFGDSIGYGYNNNSHSFVDILDERGIFESVHKNCVSGSTTATLTARLQESATEVAEADIIYCEYEANDIVGLKAGTLTTSALVSTVRNCTSYIRNANQTCTIIWMPLTIQHLSKIAGTDLSYYQSWVNAMYPVFAELGINMIPIYDTLNANHAGSDGRHPNDAGHEAIADLVMQMPLGTSNYPTALMTEWTGGAY